MNQTQKFFLAALSDHLSGRQTVAPVDVDWDQIQTLATNHQLGGMIYYQCQSFIPEPNKSSLKRRYALELYMYQNRVSLFNAVSTAFAEHGIPFFTVKGLNIAAYYPHPVFRTMGDCDIVVHERDKCDAHNVLISLGFRNEHMGEREWTYSIHDLEFELHHNLLYRKYGNTEEGLVFCEKAWEYCDCQSGTQFVLNLNYHYIFLLLHLHKHLICTGIGIRQFMDLYVMGKRAALNWTWIRSTLNKLKLLNFHDVCIGLMKYWFDNGVETEDKIEQTEKILGNGIFGFQDETNKEKQKADMIIASHCFLPIARIRCIIRSAFPPYCDMRHAEHYKLLNGRPYLLPVFWFYRFYCAIRYGLIDNGKQMIGDAMVSRKEIENREQELQKWGL